MAIIQIVECFGNRHFVDDTYKVKDQLERKKSMCKLYRLNVKGFFEGTIEQQEAFREKQRLKYGDE